MSRDLRLKKMQRRSKTMMMSLMLKLLCKERRTWLRLKLDHYQILWITFEHAIVINVDMDMIMYLSCDKILSECANVFAHAFLTSHAGKLPPQDLPFLPARSRLASVSHYDRLASMSRPHWYKDIS